MLFGFLGDVKTSQVPSFNQSIKIFDIKPKDNQPNQGRRNQAQQGRYVIAQLNNSKRLGFSKPFLFTNCFF